MNCDIILLVFFLLVDTKIITDFLGKVMEGTISKELSNTAVQFVSENT